MKEYVLSVGAEFDLDEIWEYIADDSIDAADRWVGSYSTHSMQLREIPDSAIGGKILPIAPSSSGPLEPTWSSIEISPSKSKLLR